MFIMKIRKAKKGDKKEFVNLCHQSFIEDGTKKKDISVIKIRKQFDEFLNSNKKIFLMVEDKNSIKGYLAADISKNIWQKSGYINDVFIAKGERGKGIGTLLLKKVIKIIKSKGIKKIRLSVDLKNTGAQRLYERFGFKKTQYDMVLKV
jgi:ribosomal protein S18 acetylase RimI-like enzyme